MKAFFKTQLKIYFRLLSTFLTPLGMGFVYIVIVLALKSALPKEESKQLLLGNHYAEIKANITLFCIFMVTAFVTQTFFFKYKREGLDYVLFSKPISKKEIYLTNILTSMIGLTFSSFIITFEFFISQLIIPAGIKEATLSSLSFFAACLLCALFALGIGALIQTFVDAKVFQIIVAVVPFLVIAAFGFIKSPSQTNAIVATLKAAKQPTILVPSNVKGAENANESIDNLQERFLAQKSWLSENLSSDKLFENAYDLNFNPLNKNAEPEKHLSLIDYINKSNKGVYNKIYWANFREYFLPVMVGYNSNLLNFSVSINYNKKLNDGNFFKFLDNNGNLNNETLEILKNDYKIDLKEYILVKTKDGQLFTLKYNSENFLYIFEWEQDKEKIISFKYGDIQDKTFNIFKQFNNYVIKQIVDDNNELVIKLNDYLLNEVDLKEYVTGDNVNAVGLSIIIDYLSKISTNLLFRIQKEITREEFSSILTEIIKEAKAKSESKETLEELKPIYKKISQIKTLKLKLLAELFPKDKLDKIKLDEIFKIYIDQIKENLKSKTPIQKSKYEAYQKWVIKRAVKHLCTNLWTILVFKQINYDPNSSQFKGLLNTESVVPYLSKNSNNYLTFARDYKQSTLSLMKLNNNVIEFERKIPIQIWASVLITISASLIMIAAGYSIFKRKNFN